MQAGSTWRVMFLVVVLAIGSFTLAAAKFRADSVERAEIEASDIRNLSDGEHVVHRCKTDECRGQELVAIVKQGEVIDYKVMQSGRELREVGIKEFGRVPDGGRRGSVGQTEQGDCYECVRDNDGNEHCYQVPC